MNRKLHLLVVCLFFIGFQTAFSQEVKNEPQKPVQIGVPTKIEQVPSLASRMNSLVRPNLMVKDEAKDGRSRSSRIDLVIGKGSKGDDILAKNPHKLTGKISGRSPELVFETGVSSSQPTDPAGAVGPNHYISVINTAYQIFDKEGNSLTNGLVAPSNIFTLSNQCCDLTASYDNDADRWVLSILSTTAGTQIAVSDGPDPVNTGWTLYTWGQINDYQKLSVWRDGYYMTDQQAANQVHVFERAAMIDNDASTVPQIVTFALPGLATSGFHSTQVLNISNGDWPTSGGATVIFLQDDAYPGVSEDHIKIWTIDMDWADTANSTVSAAQELRGADGVTPFVSVFDGGSFANLDQPNGGSRIDALQAIIMNQAQYRRFPSYNSAIFNFVVDVDGSAAKQAGIRWYEIRQTTDGEPWTIHQEGTYTAPDERHAWNASMIMDVQGNIGMGYTSMSSPNSTDDQVYAGSYYTGRFANDPLGTMTVEEEVITAGNGNFPGDRYGDYSKIDVDPENDKKFWFVNEVIDNQRKNVAAVFQIAPNFNNDIGVVSIDSPSSGALTATESVTVTIFNFGENPASTFDVIYTVNGSPVVTEAYNGAAIPSGQSAQFTFAATADLSVEGTTYNITSATSYPLDQDNGNNGITQQVVHNFANDLGVTAITAPMGGQFLSGTESITVTIENFGTASQSNFDVSYKRNTTATPVVENVPGPLAAGASMSYTFTTTANFSAIGTYVVSAETNLPSDSFNGNNKTEVTFETVPCIAGVNDTEQPVGPNNGDVTNSIITIADDVNIEDVNVTINIDHTYVGDLDISLIGPDGTTEVVLVDRVGSNGDNFTNTTFDDAAATSINSASAPFTGTFSPDGSLADFNGMQSAGDWTLQITDNANLDGGTLLNWSIQICTDPATLTVDQEELAGDLRILNKGNNQFEIILTSDVLTEDLDLNIYSIIGQKLLWKTMKNEGGMYTYNLDMSYAASGIYLIRLGNNNSGTTQRILVE
jgi:subtilisin-like proprotein convertase family protein